jgi:hypothetical protein
MKSGEGSNPRVRWSGDLAAPRDPAKERFMKKGSLLDVAEKPEARGFRPPMVYVYEGTAWEYKRLSRDLTQEGLPIDEEMNALGGDGWELVGVVSHPNGVHFYFKRLRRSK